ncbi:phosphatase PAP2 family protein [Arthrobacter sp. ISL-85]|nr:phosphatase PAP2 family protein [Arthrobacter sp. ISL-85]
MTRRLGRPILLTAARITGVILTEVIAHLVGRSRPPGRNHDAWCRCDFFLPSGHVVGGSNFLFIDAYLVFPHSSHNIDLIAAIGAAAVGLTVEAASRIYVGYHWFTDTGTSASLSIVLLAVVIVVDISRGEAAAEM